MHLIDTDSGKLVAMIEASHLGMMRTGAASGVATKYMARENATTVGMIGAGKQAVGQLEAVCAVRKITSAKVYSRKSEKAREFCAAMSAKLGIKMEAVTSAPEAVRGVDIINVITKASNPVLLGEWLEPGQQINAAGSNALTRRELDEAAITRCARVVVDSRNTARNESGDLLPLVENGKLDWDTLPELGELIAGHIAGRMMRDEITVYESHGMGIQDIYTGHHVLKAARALGISASTCRSATKESLTRMKHVCVAARIGGITRRPVKAIVRSVAKTSNAVSVDSGCNPSGWHEFWLMALSKAPCLE